MCYSVLVLDSLRLTSTEMISKGLNCLLLISRHCPTLLFNFFVSYCPSFQASSFNGFIFFNCIDT